MKSKLPKPYYIKSSKRWRIKINLPEGKQKSFYSSDPSPRKAQAECRRKAEAWLQQEQKTTNTFGRLWNEYLKDYARVNQETSLNQLNSRAKAHLLPVFANVKITNIKKRDWQQVINRAYDNGAKSQKTLKGIATTIRSFCKWCAVQGYISDYDVPLYFSIPSKEIRLKKILQPNELALLFSKEVESENNYIFVFRFLVRTGLRRGELCALQRDRDFINNYIIIRESISHEGIITHGKTKQANRSILLEENTRLLIDAHNARCKAKSKYLFPDINTGKAIPPRKLSNEWRKWRALHGIDVSVHELRHTHISYSRLKSGITLEELKKLYGHSASMNTDRTYVHDIDKSVEEKKKEMEKQQREAEIIADIFDTIIAY